MKIFVPPGKPSDGSEYIAEIFRAFGLCFAERCNLSDSLKAANPMQDLLVLPHGSETTGVEQFLRAGGSVLAIKPDASIEKLMGLSRKKEEAGPSRLRIVQPICYGARGESLWTLGTIQVYEPAPGSHVTAYLSLPGDAHSDTIGIAEFAVGAGRLIVFAYDPVYCIARLRQGYPERANKLPGTQETPRAAFLQHPNAPSDTLFRPTADLHALVLCDVVKREMSRRAPVPILWHLPEGQPSILLFSGDEDNAEQDANDLEMRDLESVGGAMSLYVIPDLTSITRKRIEEYSRRGHPISVHPNLVPTAGEAPAVQLLTAEKQVRLFQEKFQWPTHTVRNHYYMWPGYVKLPELWERLGIGMDANTCATQHFESPENGPFANVHAAIPLRFVREDGSLIDVYQQATHVNDDLAVHPTTFYSQKLSTEQFDRLVQRILGDAISFFHVPICVNMHPANYARFTASPARALMALARSFKLPIWSLDRWHNFWRARASWRLSEYSWDGSSLRFLLAGSPCESLSLLLPSGVDGRPLQALRVAGMEAQAEFVERQGMPAAQVSLPRQATDVEVVVEYSDR